MHAGNIFSALISWIIARRFDGLVVLRIEDIDSSRCRQHYAADIMRDLSLLGLGWDTGPFYQSSRIERYRGCIKTLDDEGMLYPCFCSRADLHAASAPHAGEASVYGGACRLLDNLEVRRRTEELALEGRSPVLRVHVCERSYTTRDLLQGEATFSLQSDVGDFVVLRSNGDIAYQLAVAIDDADMGVNMVVRGADLIPSVPAQRYLQDLLKLPTPSYAHVPLLTAPEGDRLSKRHGDAALDALLDALHTPERVLGRIAYVCGLVGEDRSYSANELAACADLDAIAGTTSLTWA